MRRTLIVATIVAILALGSPSHTWAQAMNAGAVVDAYTEAINAGDVDGALSFVADNAVYMRPAGQFIGKDQVRGFIEDLVLRAARIELQGEREVYGEYVTWRSRVAFGNPGAGPAEVRNQSRSVVIDGKIVFHMATPAQ
jgi:hypothetical protein